jgi:hypothetical protein
MRRACFFKAKTLSITTPRSMSRLGAVFILALLFKYVYLSVVLSLAGSFVCFCLSRASWDYSHDTTLLCIRTSTYCRWPPLQQMWCKYASGFLHHIMHIVHIISSPNTHIAYKTVHVSYTCKSSYKRWNQWSLWDKKCATLVSSPPPVLGKFRKILQPVKKS